MQPSGAPVPFDRTLSLSLDRLIVLLDMRPAAPRRWVLRLSKRWAERAVPAWEGRGR